MSAVAIVLVERDRVDLDGAADEGVMDVLGPTAVSLLVALALPRVFGGSAAGCLLTASCSFPSVIPSSDRLLGSSGCAAFGMVFFLAEALADAVVI